MCMHALQVCVCVCASKCLGVCSSLNNGPRDFPHLTVFVVLQGPCVGSGGENVVGIAEGR